MSLLEVHDIHTFYGNIEALKGISLTVDDLLDPAADTWWDGDAMDPDK